MALIATTKRLILGAGSTGQAVARHFQALGIRFEVADTRTSKTLKSEFHNEFIFCRNRHRHAFFFVGIVIHENI